MTWQQIDGQLHPRRMREMTPIPQQGVIDDLEKTMIKMKRLPHPARISLYQTQSADANKAFEECLGQAIPFAFRSAMRPKCVTDSVPK